MECHKSIDIKGGQLKMRWVTILGNWSILVVLLWISSLFQVNNFNTQKKYTERNYVHKAILKRAAPILNFKRTKNEQKCIYYRHQ